MNKRRLTGALALGAAASLALAGCTGGTDIPDAPDAGGGAGEAVCGTVTLGFLPSWTDGLSTAYLLENQLEKLGLTVEMTTLTEAGPLYTGLAQGDIDIYPSAWPELTHASYMEEYGDRIEDLGAYYSNAKLTIAVPEYVDIDSLAELADAADRFDGRIYGIEPGAGLTRQTQESMIPAYGLEGSFDLVTSSTAAMLTQLGEAISSQEDIIVTLWRPFWANDAYPIKDLEDPLGAMGDPESLHFLGTAGFSERCPEAAMHIAGIKLDDAAYGSLEDLVVNEYGEGREAEAVAAWIEQNPTAFPSLIPE